MYIKVESKKKEENADDCYFSGGGFED